MHFEFLLKLYQNFSRTKGFIKKRALKIISEESEFLLKVDKLIEIFKTKT